MTRSRPKTPVSRRPAKGRVTIRAARAKVSKVVSPDAPKPASNRAERAAGRHAGRDRTWNRPRRNPAQEPGAISPDPDCARDDRGDLAEPVCATRATGRERDVSRPSRSDFWRTEDDMTSSQTTLRILAALAL